MLRRTGVLLFVALTVPAFFGGTAIAQSRVDLPNDCGIELLGRSILYSFTYQRQLNQTFAVEGGISAFGGGGDDENTMILFFPVGGRVYFIPKNGSPFIAGGINFVNASFDNGPFGDDNDSTTFGYAGLGMEYRSPSGFLFRGTAYGLIADGGFFIWPGLYVGYAF
jgi:hypothetical protein